MNKFFSEYSGLYGIVDLSFKSIVDPILWTKEFVKYGIKIIQLRAKYSSAAEIYNLAVEMRKVIPAESIFIVNDRPDIAYFSGADGVHLGQDDIPPSVVKEKYPNMVIGYSTHNEEQVIRANFLDVDYIGFGPVYPTKSKEKPDPVVGVNLLQKVIGISNYPIVAIGGINKKNINNVLKPVKPKFYCIVSGLANSKQIGEDIGYLQNLYKTL